MKLGCHFSFVLGWSHYYKCPKLIAMISNIQISTNNLWNSKLSCIPFAHLSAPLFPIAVLRRLQSDHTKSRQVIGALDSSSRGSLKVWYCERPLSDKEEKKKKKGRVGGSKPTINYTFFTTAKRKLIELVVFLGFAFFGN